MRRPAALILVALAVLLLAAAGCGGSASLQRQESLVRARTCQSLFERDLGAPAPPISANHFLDETRVPPRHLSDTINEKQLVNGCREIEHLSGRVAGLVLPSLSQVPFLVPPGPISSAPDHHR